MNLQFNTNENNKYFESCFNQKPTLHDLINANSKSCKFLFGAQQTNCSKCNKNPNVKCHQNKHCECSDEINSTDKDCLSEIENMKNLKSNCSICLNKPKLAFMKNDDLHINFSGLSNPSLLVKINVSGTIFHIRHTTLQNDPYMYGKFLEDAVWIDDTKEYYFERDPEVFKFIHSYLRRGELHLPQNMCGPLVEKELDNWGIPLGLDIRRCCLGPVMESKFKMESLQKFEKKLEPQFVSSDNWLKYVKIDCA